MREIVASQLPLVPSPFDHAHARELTRIAEVLESLPEAAQWVHADLVRQVRNPKAGRGGMSGEQVLRVLLVKQMAGFSYEELAFHLGDSMTYRAFCKLGIGEPSPGKSTLKRNLKLVRAETLEKVHWLLLELAVKAGIEKGRKVRFDCTVTETNIHEPSDSSLLWDCVRVLVRGMVYAKEWVSVPFRNHTLAAKRRSFGIQYAKTSKARDKLYRKLLELTRATVESARRVAAALAHCELAGPMEYARVQGLAQELESYIALADKVLEQTGRRIYLGDNVPAKDKVVSIFEPHTDIIVKDRRNTLYGHKLCLATGSSGLVLDCRIEDGNPADATLAVEMVERQADIFERVPRQVAFDGGFASKANLLRLKELGVQDVMFHKKRGLEVQDMAKSPHVYRALRRFRAGIEAGISYLKRCFGLDRCTWRSLRSFKAYTWASILAANLLTLARHTLA
jgi:IS5 family transposase